MNQNAVDLSSIRARKARWAERIGKRGYDTLFVLSIIFVLLAPAVWFMGIHRLTFFSLSVALICYMPAVWYRYDLSIRRRSGDTLTDRLSGDALARLARLQAGTELAPQSVWQLLRPHWQAVFLLNHLLLDGSVVEGLMSRDPSGLAAVWQEAARMSNEAGEELIEVGFIVAALMRTSPEMVGYLRSIKLTEADVDTVAAWLGRVLDDSRLEKPDFGGIGRDWANGFTPLLNRFGFNISLAIESHGAHFGYLMTAPSVEAIKSAFSQGASAVALVGETGVGKTSHVHALAQLLLQEKNDRNLEHRQIIALDPSSVLSNAHQPGEVEQIVTTLLAEAAHAGHIILFLDDAQLFFSDAHGALDITRILLPVVQSRAVQMVLAMTPHDYQSLRADNPAFASLLTPIVLNEPAEPEVLRVLEDTALTLEHRHKVLVTYEAIKEAYVLSGRYEADQAYPGRAIRLMEQSLSYAEHDGIVTPGSVQRAIEQSHGVKVGQAAPAEADTLLNLEDRIHERMINQKQAVSVVASALRRARAGVANPRRPIGSFLFLGPTGVGKTELAKAVAATYFQSESTMIRLDMSEYQQPEDVGRLLSNGANESSSLIMAVRQQPFSVVLLDEIEKAHPNILNLLLQLLDEGQLTDTGGKAVSFKDCVIIATSNAGADTIRERIAQGQQIEALETELTDQLINSGQFKPELLNRFDEIVIFRPLTPEELTQVVALMLKDINTTLANQNISVELTPEATRKVVDAGYDPRLGARPMRRVLQRTVQDSIAGQILRGEAHPGDHVVLDAPDLAVDQPAR